MLKTPFNINMILDDLLADRITRGEASSRLWNLINDDRSEIADDLEKIRLTLLRSL